MGVIWQRDEQRSVLPEHDLPPSAPPPPHRMRWRLLAWLVVLAGAAVLGVLLYFELQTSRLQSREFSRYAATLSYSVGNGPSPAIHFPEYGPYDRRLGYTALPEWLPRLEQRGFEITRQARFSQPLLEYSRHRLFPPYAEKPQAGLTISDCRGMPLYSYRLPKEFYSSYASIPPLVVHSLLFIENRYLLDPSQPLANPAVDWPRFSKAALSQVREMFGLAGQSAGGSTLATQIEKYRHSPDGLTDSAMEKLRQMFSASVRAYQNGPQTMEARQNVVRDYLNSVPLAAAPGYGEVHGLADGLRVWYGADFARVNRLLASADASLAERGLALRQVLSLLIAQRRPSHYLVAGREELAALTDSHIRLLRKGGQIDPGLAEAALAQRTAFRDWMQEPAVQPIETTKGISVARSRLATLLQRSLYDLDRFDLSASTPLQGELQEAITRYLGQLADPAFAESIGLFGERLLSPEKTAEVRYSFTLFERSGDSFLVRVQTDSTAQPFDINEGSKLELGSTAKLRVLTTYLEIIAELHARFAGQDRAALRAAEAQTEPLDFLTRWAIEWLMMNPEGSLPTMLDAALERRYSASPGESFFTGGGLHTFANFRKEDNGRRPTMRESLRESINLPFVRLLRDIVRYTIYQSPNNSVALLKDDQDPRRLEYLTRFADREGTVYLRRFWNKYRGKSSDERLATFLEGLRVTPVRLAAVHRYLLPQSDRASFDAFLRAHLPNDRTLTEKRLDSLYRSYGPGAYNLPDQGYIARVHPLDLWLLGYLIQHPAASYQEVVEASRDERQEVYGWLFKSRHRSARDSRIRTMVEVEAFLDIHQRWQRLGYPFPHLVPSLATALGSSGDRPAALAELIGIILNDGVRLPVVRIDSLEFAVDTPYETRLGLAPDRARRVLAPEVAAALRGALAQVVENGTARRLFGSFQQADGTPLTVGGKTGTGDNRIQRVARGGYVVSSQALNRTATFVFYLGPNHFGTLTAYVPGRAAEKFRFTSALPVQVLKGMAPILQPYLQGQNSLCQAAPATARH
ncbi:transglycosylase domain-containing protein [Azotobacter salinestris]|uniref:transglycosylase domain-containing protein n=1 Tax=Azotobacter salinestris TaxID=69964 RepID=UPI001266AC1C